MDKYLLDFLGNNLVTITLLLMILKGLAVETSWKWDEKIVNVLSEAFQFLRGNKK